VSEELAEQLKSKFARAMPQCATGRRPHSLEIIVENYEGGGAGQAFLIGARSMINAQFIIRPVGSEVSVGDYQMQEILAGGGLLGAAAMAQSEAILSQNLAERLCKEVWGIHLQP